MTTLIESRRRDDILPEYRDTPIGDLLAWHNLGVPPRPYARPETLVVMCMDFRKRLSLPDNFAYVLRVGGANAAAVDPYVAFAVAVARVRAVAVIVHDDCAMAAVASRRGEFVSGLVANAGWDRAAAEAYVAARAAAMEIGEPAAFAAEQCRSLRDRYPGIVAAPLFYSVADGLLRQVREAP